MSHSHNNTDEIIGTTGDDTITALASTSYIEGGGGFDTVVFSGDYADYTFTPTHSLLKSSDSFGNVMKKSLAFCLIIWGLFSASVSAAEVCRPIPYSSDSYIQYHLEKIYEQVNSRIRLVAFGASDSDIRYFRNERSYRLTPDGDFRLFLYSTGGRAVSISAFNKLKHTILRDSDGVWGITDEYVKAFNREFRDYQTVHFTGLDSQELVVNGVGIIANSSVRTYRVNGNIKKVVMGVAFFLKRGNLMILQISRTYKSKRDISTLKADLKTVINSAVGRCIIN